MIHWPRHGPAGEDDTEVFPRPDEEPDTVVLPAVAVEPTGRAGSLAKASGSMAVATLVSRATGFLRSIVLVWVVGAAATADAYNAANTLPNQVYELLVGGVLTSVLVPVLVRAFERDSDGGERYTQQLLTVTTVTLVAVTVLAVAGAPLLTGLVVGNSTGQADPALATAFAFLLLPQILCYGLAALLTAVLNARRRFAPGAWAPVLNNAVLLGTFAWYRLLPGPGPGRHAAIDDPHVLVLGVGSTLGVAVQAVVLVPFVVRGGLRLRWRWGWDRRMAEFGRLACWTVAYGLVSQVGVVVVSHIATDYVGLTVYQLVWLLIQMPYGVIGFSLITAILPRMSGAAARNDHQAVIDDLSLATRSCVVTMLPISVLLTVLGPAAGTALFSIGRGSGAAGQFGAALAWGAFGLLPYAVTLLQLRVFYAMRDARTPTVIVAVMIVVKIALALAVPHLLAPAHVVYGLTFANSASMVIGWLAGEIWLRSRLGRLGARRLARTLAKTVAASAAGAVFAVLVHELIGRLVAAPIASAWLTLLAGGGAGLGVTAGALLLLRTDELRPITRRFRRGPRPGRA